MEQADLCAFARHGGRLDAAAAAFPHAPRPWIDLSTGINPVAWVPPATLVVDAGPLPTRGQLAALEAAAARHFGVAPAAVVAVPGSEIALRLLPALGLPGPLIARGGGYRTHRDVAAAVIAHDAAAPEGATLLIANPDNPEGRMIAPAMLLALARRLAASGGWLIVDEAFADAVPGIGILPHREAELPVIVLRSFGKFFGLAGLRLGFVVAPAAIARRLRGLLGDWPVSAHALAWGQAAYADTPWIAATAEALAVAARRLDAVLARYGAVQGECPLFRLLEGVDGRALFARLARAGILTRPFADRPDRLRVGLPADAAAWTRLEQALADG